jgi:phage terminase small subunit
VQLATRGAKPKPAHLRLVDGTTNVTRHGPESDARDQVERAAASFGKLARPKHLRAEALAAWKRYIEPAGWLDASREAAAIAFCELWQEFRNNPRGFPASKHGQLRAYMGELGLTDERNRGDSGKEEPDEFLEG